MVYTYGTGPRYTGKHAATISVQQPQPTTHNGLVDPGMQMNGAHMNYQPVYPQIPQRFMNLNVPIREPSPPPPQHQPVKEAPKQEDQSPPPSTSHEDLPGAMGIRYHNVVCNYVLPLHIDLRQVAIRSASAIYDRGSSTLLQQLRDPSCYVRVQSSGKVLIIGCKSEMDAMRAARRVARQVQRHMNKLDRTVRIRNYKVCNVMASCRMPFGINIEEMARRYPQAEYEPELYIGLKWKFTDPKAVLRIHTTGSIGVTGATSEEGVRRAIELISPIVHQFKSDARYRGGDPDEDELFDDAPKGARRKPTRKRVRKQPSNPPDAGFSMNKRSRFQAKEERATASTGVYGNKVYFSDEEDIY